jgi:hypothetical protein
MADVLVSRARRSTRVRTTILVATGAVILGATSYAVMRHHTPSVVKNLPPAATPGRQASHTGLILPSASGWYNVDAGTIRSIDGLSSPEFTPLGAKTWAVLQPRCASCSPGRVFLATKDSSAVMRGAQASAVAPGPRPRTYVAVRPKASGASDTAQVYDGAVPVGRARDIPRNTYVISAFADGLILGKAGQEPRAILSANKEGQPVHRFRNVLLCTATYVTWSPRSRTPFGPSSVWIYHIRDGQSLRRAIRGSALTTSIDDARSRLAVLSQLNELGDSELSVFSLGGRQRPLWSQRLRLPLGAQIGWADGYLALTAGPTGPQRLRLWDTDLHEVHNVLPPPEGLQLHPG